MKDALRIILPLYFIIYFGLAFVLKSFVVARRTGKNPLVLPKDDSAYGLIGFYFKIALITMFVYVLTFSAFPEWFGVEGFFKIVDTPFFTYSGLTLLGASLIWTIIAQNHMHNSWRIGIDTETKTELVTTGLFSLSRNPIFFGMIVSLLGLFFVTPNAWTFLILVIGYMLVQVQIRLEEEFLIQQHGQAYADYCCMVRRLI